MKKSVFYSLAFMILMPMFSNCTNEDLNAGNESAQNEVTVQFVGEITGQLSSRAVSANEASSKELCIVAYRKVSDGKYKYVKHKDATVTAADNNKITWSDAAFKLEVGTYRFLGFYNISKTNTKLDLSFIADDAVEKTWDEIKNGVTISRKANIVDLNINEIFAGGSSDDNSETTDPAAEDVDLSDLSGENTVTVNLVLTRVNSRIDFRFLKFSPENEGGAEQSYSDSNYTIFGVNGNLKSITTTTSNSSNSWTFGTTASIVGDKMFTYTTTDNTGVYYGTKTNAGTDFPNGDADKDKMENIPVDRISQGAAYYKGAYILPFVNAADKKINLEVTIKGRSKVLSDDSNDTEQIRVLKADNVPVEENKVTVVTFKYRASNNIPDDKEDLFDPTIKYDITIETQWNGVVSGPTLDV